jgi:hypothetical protein
MRPRIGVAGAMLTSMVAGAFSTVLLILATAAPAGTQQAQLASPQVSQGVRR